LVNVQVLSIWQQQQPALQPTVRRKARHGRVKLFTKRQMQEGIPCIARLPQKTVNQQSY
jgi:hypothetical protein